MRRLPRLALATALLLASCGSPAEKGSGSTIPSDGTIVYHDPVIAEHPGSKRTPVTQIFTTAEGELAEESSYQTFSGTVEGVGSRQPIPERQMKKAIERMFHRTKAGSTRVLPPADFKMLWGRLEAAGLFKLPPYKGSGRPEAEHFLVKSGDRTWIFLRPAPDAVLKDDPTTPLIKLWSDVKGALITFLNEQ